MNQQFFACAAVDLDGTLVQGSHVSQENLQAARRLVQLGLTVVITTGRNFHQSVGFHRQLGLSGPMVSSDGALVAIPGGKILQEKTLPLEVSNAILRMAFEQGVSCLCYHRHGITVTSKFDWNENMERHREMGKHFTERERSELSKQRLYKVLLFSQEPARLDRLKKAVAETFGTIVDSIRNGPETLEFVLKGVSKVSGLRKVAIHLGVSPGSFLAFGDGNNDVGMFGWAGLSVSMHHGTALARESAKIIAPETSPEVNFAAGVDAVIARLGLKAA
ncbi:MAG TPA: HAD family hydrolase [Oculatellaceae cyanobacterium]